MLTQDELKNNLHYEPETGIFTRMISKTNCVKVGDIAGTMNTGGYIVINVNGKPHTSHRLAYLYMEGSFPADQVDHINHIRSDNRWKNLRVVTNSENQRNQTLPSNNTSGFIGVHWHKYSKRWRAEIAVDGKIKSLGKFHDINEAVKARKAADVKYGYHKTHGEILQCPH